MLSKCLVNGNLTKWLSNALYRHNGIFMVDIILLLFNNVGKQMTAEIEHIPTEVIQNVRLSISRPKSTFEQCHEVVSCVYVTPVMVQIGAPRQVGKQKWILHVSLTDRASLQPWSPSLGIPREPRAPLCQTSEGEWRAATLRLREQLFLAFAGIYIRERVPEQPLRLRRWQERPFYSGTARSRPAPSAPCCGVKLSWKLNFRQHPRVTFTAPWSTAPRADRQTPPSSLSPPSSQWLTDRHAPSKNHDKDFSVSQAGF